MKGNGCSYFKVQQYVTAQMCSCNGGSATTTSNISSHVNVSLVSKCDVCSKCDLVVWIFMKHQFKITCVFVCRWQHQWGVNELWRMGSFWCQMNLCVEHVWGCLMFFCSGLMLNFFLLTSGLFCCLHVQSRSAQNWNCYVTNWNKEERKYWQSFF